MSDPTPTRAGAQLLVVRDLATDDDNVVAAERDVLGSMLIDGDCVGDVAALLRPDDFALPRHVTIFRAIVAEHRVGGAASPLTVGERLQRLGQLEEAGGHDYLLDLLDSVVTGAGVQRHAEIVHDAAARRRLAAAAADVARAARDGAPLEELLAMLEQAKPRPVAPPARRGRSWLDVADDPPVEWIADGLLPTAGLVVLAGDPNAGKSALAIDLALRAAHGLQWLGRELSPCSTVYISYEGSLGARMRAWRQAHPSALTVDGHYLHFDEDRRPNLTQPDALQQLERVLDGAAAANGGRQPSVLVIDTLARATAGGDENDSGALGMALEALAELQRRRGVTVLLLHHTRKPQAGTSAKADGMHALRGSSALAGAADVVLLAMSGDGDVRTLRTAKVRDGEILPPLHYRIVGQDTGRNRRNGRHETAPVVLPAEHQAAQAIVDPAADADAMVTQAVDVLHDMGGAPSPTAITVRMTGRREARFAAVGVAIERGAIEDRGKGATPRLVAIAPRSRPPHTPPTAGSGPGGPGGPGPLPLPRLSGERSGASGSGIRKDTGDGRDRPMDPAEFERRARLLQQRAASVGGGDGLPLPVGEAARTTA